MEFSKEEKEAIEDIDLLVHCLNYGEMKITIASERQKEIAQELQMLINLLNKQQKEIEENQILIDDIKDHRIVYIDTPEFEEKFINKDKIREKIKELETLYNCNLDTALTSYEMFVFVRSYIDKVKNILNELVVEENNEESDPL